MTVVEPHASLTACVHLAKKRLGSYLFLWRRPHDLPVLGDQGAAHRLILVVQIEAALDLRGEGPRGQQELGDVVGQPAWSETQALIVVESVCIKVRRGADKEVYWHKQ